MNTTRAFVETPRLRLRDWREDDFPAFAAMNADARSRRVMEKAGMRFVREFDHPAVPREHPLARHALYRAKRAA